MDTTFIKICRTCSARGQFGVTYTNDKGLGGTLKRAISILENWIAPWFDSEIISHFPSIVHELRRKQIVFLSLGREGGFRTQDFQKKCENYANMVTLIDETNENIIGGFSPETWKSHE
jgi:hypothetical protein